MAKRRRRKPNISKAALDQARQDAGDSPTEPQSAAASPPKQEPAAPKAAADTSIKPRRRRRDLQSTQLEKRKSEGALDAEYIAELLANPSKTVSEEDLRADYSFVIKDLRSMGMLAVALFAALVAVSLLLL